LYEGQSHAFRLDPELGFAAAFDVQPVPEPGTLPILAIGFGMLAFCAHRLKRTA
jgi:hypothetical protein